MSLCPLLFGSEGMWPRLQVSHQKPHWLQVDFDHYVDDADSEEGEGEGEGEGEAGGPVNPVRI